MEISKIDKNFQTTFEAPEDIEWFSALSLPFTLHGVYYEETEKRFRRMPAETADRVNEGVKVLATHTAGGRLRFRTDSPFVAVRAIEPYTWFMSHMAVTGQCGFTLYGDNGYIGTAIPQSNEMMENEKKERMVFDALLSTNGAENDYTLYFPLYNGVNELYIGLKKGCRLEKAAAYAHEKPVVFYGSSITQGGCASKAGDDYVNRLSALLDTEILNLGFSGSARGETVMAEYLASLNPSVFVIDYDHNAPNAEHLAETHYALYKTIRNKHPATPIIFVSAPLFTGTLASNGFFAPRYEIIKRTYERAGQEGDKNVYLICGEGFLGEAREYECGTVDGCHPDSFGFYLMAKAIAPTLEKILKKI